MVLTIIAYRRGWRWWALLPSCVVLLLALLVGTAIGLAFGGIGGGFGPITTFLDCSHLIVLTIMALKAPTEETKEFLRWILLKKVLRR